MNKIIRLLALPAIILGSLVTARAAVETYTIDSVHSSIGFSIRHFVSKVPGTFTKFTGTIAFDKADPAKSSVETTISVNSVSTGAEKRDAHLNTPDFFDTAKYATATFKSTAWAKTGEDTYDVTGDFTLHGVTKSIVLKVTSLGFGDGMGGTKLSGWEATTTIKKSDFGVSGPAMLGKALGDDVALTISIEAGIKPVAKS